MTESETLLATLRYYVTRAGLAHSQTASLAAAELLNEVVVEALEHAERFRPDGQPRAWLLGIAANLIKRQQVARAKRNRRSMQGELITILEEAVGPTVVTLREVRERAKELGLKTGDDAVQMIREDRDSR